MPAGADAWISISAREPGPYAVPPQIPETMSSERRKPYPFDVIEPRWQSYWEEHRTFEVPNPGQPGFDPSRPEILRAGYVPLSQRRRACTWVIPEGYTATDIMGRYKRMCGF